MKQLMYEFLAMVFFLLLSIEGFNQVNYKHQGTSSTLGGGIARGEVYTSQILIGEALVGQFSDTVFSASSGLLNTPVVCISSLVTGLTLPNCVQVGDIVEGKANYSVAGGIAVNWEWGDGSISSGMINDSVITGEHSYYSSGLYDVKIDLTNDCGKIVSSLYSYIVVFNPSAGCVLGNGQFSSPPGAYFTDPGAGGQASYDFKIKYKDELPEPTGFFTFNINDAGLTFVSDSMQWLMVNNDQAIFKGSGKLSDTTTCSFLVSVIDGDAEYNGDFFRLIVRDEDDKIVYDNQPGDQDKAAAVQKIDDGEVSITQNCNFTNIRGKLHNKLKGTALRLYPNPVRDFLHLNLTNYDQDEIQFNVVSMDGCRHSNANCRLVNGKGKIDLRNMNLIDGIYMLCVFDDDKNIILRERFIRRK